MSKYKLNFKKSALKQLLKLPNKEVVRITTLIEDYQKNLVLKVVKNLRAIVIIGEYDQEIIESFIA